MSKQLTEAAQAAKALKKELQQKFPEIIWRATSENFSMGDAVNIYYKTVDKNGNPIAPNLEKVEEISGKYQYGNFNGMEDIYEYSNRDDSIPQAKFVSVSRDWK